LTALDPEDFRQNMHRLEEDLDHNGFNVFHRAAFDFSVCIFEEAKEINRNYTSKDLKRWSSFGATCGGVTPLTIACFNYRKAAK
jgi:hypothetical protein